MKVFVSKIPADYYFSFFDDHCIVKHEHLVGITTNVVKYSDIVSLGWTAKHTTVNFVVEQYYSKLTIKKSDNKTLFLYGESSGFGQSKYYDLLCENHSVLAKRTYENRLQAYQEQIKTNGYFVYDSYQIYPDREIKRNSVDYVLHDVPLSEDSPFSLSIKKKNAGLFGSMLSSKIINLEMDRDVFLSLFPVTISEGF